MVIKPPVRYVKSDRVICDANGRVICEFNSEHNTGYDEGVCAEAICNAINAYAAGTTDGAAIDVDACENEGCGHPMNWHNGNGCVSMTCVCPQFKLERLDASKQYRPAPQPAADRLLPCPFCGGMAVERKADIMAYYIECSTCENGTKFRPTPASAAQAWNTRQLAEPKDRDALIEAAEDFLDRDDSWKVVDNPFPEIARIMADFALSLQTAGQPTCGCGKPSQYNLRKVGETENVWACNPHFRCMTYEELAEKRRDAESRLEVAVEALKKIADAANKKGYDFSEEIRVAEKALSTIKGETK